MWIYPTDLPRLAHTSRGVALVNFLNMPKAVISFVASYKNSESKNGLKKLSYA